MQRYLTAMIAIAIPSIVFVQTVEVVTKRKQEGWMRCRQSDTLRTENRELLGYMGK
jgi:hypothetical protein